MQAPKTSFELCFTGDSAIELQQTAFSSPLVESLQKAIRGKTGGAFGQIGTFQWTPAVQALCVFFLQETLRQDSDVAPVFSGEAGSLAASLDSALGKPPQWMLDMFGITESGDAIAKRLILRTNPDRKKPGPVFLSLNAKILSRTQIAVLLNDQPVTKREELEQLLQNLMLRSCSIKRREIHSPNKIHGKIQQTFSPLENLVATYCQSQEASEGPLKHDLWLERFRHAFFDEAQTMLQQTDIFSQRGIKTLLRRIYDKPYFTRLLGRRRELLNDLDVGLLSSEKLGFGENEQFVRSALTQDRPIRIAVAAGSTTIAILKYLKFVKGYNIEIQYHYAYAIEILRRILLQNFHEPPDVCVLGLAPAGTLLGDERGRDYHPLMFLPSMSHQVLASKKQSRGKKRRFYFLNNEPSTSQFYFEDLTAAGHLNRRDCVVSHAEPHEIYAALRSEEEDTRAILFFPYHLMNHWRGVATLVDQPQYQDSSKEMVLFAHSSLMKDKKRALALNIAIRDAWLELRDNPPVLKAMTELILHDRGIMRFLLRTSGISGTPELSPLTIS